VASKRGGGRSAPRFSNQARAPPRRLAKRRRPRTGTPSSAPDGATMCRRRVRGHRPSIEDLLGFSCPRFRIRASAPGCATQATYLARSSSVNSMRGWRSASGSDEPGAEERDRADQRTGRRFRQAIAGSPDHPYFRGGAPTGSAGSDASTAFASGRSR
jgi:hypothetical protein